MTADASGPAYVTIWETRTARENKARERGFCAVRRTWKDMIKMADARTTMPPTTTILNRLTSRLNTATHDAADRLTSVTDRLSAALPGDRSVWRRRLALAQGGYYAVTGVWPFLHMRSFEAVTGPKTDHWLVQTVGALVGILGSALLTSGGRAEGPSQDLASTAAATAVGLALLEATFVAQRRIAPVYLLDAAAELALVAGWMAMRDGNDSHAAGR